MSVPCCCGAGVRSPDASLHWIFLPHSALALDRFERLAAVTYLGVDNIEYDNLSSLVGRQEAFLNKLRSDFKSELITDFIEYVALCIIAWRLPGHRAALALAGTSVAIGPWRSTMIVLNPWCLKSPRPWQACGTRTLRKPC